MAVKAIRRVQGQGRLVLATSAAEVMKEGHPLFGPFVKFCGVNPPTKRQARKFLQKHEIFHRVRVG
jgi:hypothetical protein